MKINDDLPAWADIESQHNWHTLLLGNGASIALWKKFTYNSLYQVADLSTDDHAIFDTLETKDFEQVLRTIQLSRLLCQQLNHSPDAEERYESIRIALLNAVHSVHLPWESIPNTTLRKIAKTLLTYKRVFSTNYDLILYWAVMSMNAAGFKDLFWSGDSTCFDPENVEIYNSSKSTAIYYLHGGIHLVEQTNGLAFKRTADGQSLLSSFASADQGSPLFVSEGSSEKKLRSIRSSDYLWHCYNKLKNDSRPLVIFGSALGPQDSHIAKAISKKTDRPIAISIFPTKRKDVIKTKIWFKELFEDNSKVSFFDSRTHPLGDPSLSVD
ncbi:MAG TPA: DUF4917 family protein [Archangium sp.]|nr:DUF4917 family protein [Archangium sp.]